MHQMVSAIDPDEQRTQLSRASTPSTNDDLLTAPALGLKPRLRATGLIRGAGTFRDDAFQVHPAGGLQDGIAGLRQMLHVFDQLSRPAIAGQKPLQSLLTA